MATTTTVFPQTVLAPGNYGPTAWLALPVGTTKIKFALHYSPALPAGSRATLVVDVSSDGGQTVQNLGSAYADGGVDDDGHPLSDSSIEFTLKAPSTASTRGRIAFSLTGVAVSISASITTS